MAVKRKGRGRIRALAICGSARRDGNTAFLLTKVLEGAEKAGAATELVFVSELDVKGCLGCDACKAPRTKRCAIQDDMQALYRKLERAEVWVFGTPVYWFHVSAHLKSLIDRLYAFFSFDGDYHRRLTGDRRGLAVVVQEAETDDEGREVAAYLEKVLWAAGAETAGSLVGARLREAGAAQSREDLIEEAQTLGESAVAGLREQGVACESGGPSRERIAGSR
ncbi:MAG: flavodoxin family protein [Armatimonadota bacterium]|nr:MAG: flavodoxin family protein [Armatimonadota bacterium]